MQRKTMLLGLYMLTASANASDLIPYAQHQISLSIINGYKQCGDYLQGMVAISGKGSENAERLISMCSKKIKPGTEQYMNFRAGIRDSAGTLATCGEVSGVNGDGVTIKWVATIIGDAVYMGDPNDINNSDPGDTSSNINKMARAIYNKHCQ